MYSKLLIIIGIIVGVSDCQSSSSHYNSMHTNSFVNEETEVLQSIYPLEDDNQPSNGSSSHGMTLCHISGDSHDSFDQLHLKERNH